MIDEQFIREVAARHFGVAPERLRIECFFTGFPAESLPSLPNVIYFGFNWFSNGGDGDGGNQFWGLNGHEFNSPFVYEKDVDHHYAPFFFKAFDGNGEWSTTFLLSFFYYKISII